MVYLLWQDRQISQAHLSDPKKKQILQTNTYILRVKHVKVKVKVSKRLKSMDSSTADVLHKGAICNCLSSFLPQRLVA